MPQEPSSLTRGYRVALWFCPPAFRHRFGDELAHDFEDGLHDVRRTGFAGDVPTFLLRSGADLGRTIVVQWLRTGAVLSTLLSVFGLAATVGAIDAIRSASQQAHLVRPEHEEAVILLLLFGVVMVVIGATIFLTQYLLWPRVRRRG